MERMQKDLSSVMTSIKRGVNSERVNSIMEKLFGPLCVILNGVDPIVPGQPVNFNFTVKFNTTLSLDLKAPVVSLYLVDVFDSVDENDPLFSVPIPGLMKFQSGVYESPHYSIKPTGLKVNIIYHIRGDQKLRLILKGTGKDGGPYINLFDWNLSVEPDNIDAGCWQWTIPDNQDLQWKVDHYTINGRLVSQSKYSRLNVTPVLIENDSGSESQFYCSPECFSIESGQSAQVLFNHDFVQSWDWFTNVLFTLNGAPLKKTFIYYLKIEIIDAYGNIYPDIETSSVTVSISVSESKQNAQSAATTYLGSAAVCLILADACSICASELSDLYIAMAEGETALAEQAGETAGDPPEPDRDYLKPCHIPKFKLPTSLKGEKILRPIAELGELSGQILINVSSLSKIHSKILGAEKAHDLAAKRKQQQALDHVILELANQRDMINNLVTKCIKTIRKHPTMKKDSLVVVIEQWQRDKHIPENLRNGFKNSGGSEKGLQAIETLLTVPAFVKMISNIETFISIKGRGSYYLASTGADYKKKESFPEKNR